MDLREIVGQGARPRAIDLIELPPRRDAIEVGRVRLTLAELRQQERLAAVAGGSRRVPRRRKVPTSSGRDMPRQRAVVLVSAQQDSGPVGAILVAEPARSHRLENQPEPGRPAVGQVTR